MAIHRDETLATFVAEWRLRQEHYRASLQQLHTYVREVHAETARTISDARRVCREIQIDRLRRWANVE